MAHKLLIFSDGTGQRGVRDDGASTNIERMHRAAKAADPDQQRQVTFYDGGLGTGGFAPYDLASKATGLGISKNIIQCYDFILRTHETGSRIGVFGFSRGGYTVRSLGGVLANAGVPAAVQDGINIRTGLDDQGDLQTRNLRWKIATRAVKTYQISNTDERRQSSEDFRDEFKSEEAVPYVVGVFDTVESLGLPGVTNVFNPLRHKFHDTKLSARTPYGFQALAIDENRYMFQPVMWDERGGIPGQVIEQRWFPGVHSDIGGGYLEKDLSDVALQWMIERCSQPGIEIEFDTSTIGVNPNIGTGEQHNERTGFGRFWWPKNRGDFIDELEVDRSWLCDDIEQRFDEHSPDYRPEVLQNHPRVKTRY